MSSQSIEARVQRRLQALERRDEVRPARVVELRPAGGCVIDGQSLVNFGSNDYLGLAHEVGQIFQCCARDQLGATASAAVAGRSHWHAALELALAQFEDTDAALLFPSGYAANLGVLTGLVESEDAVYCDRDNHASIIDAARLCAGKLLVYRRDRLEALEQSLQTRRNQYEHVLIVTDGVFSMDGSVAPLQDLCDLAERFDASVIVDEAHGTGVLGTHGRGACDRCDVESRVLLRVGTMSKAMGGLGGFAAASAAVIQLLRNTARPQFFSTALPPAICEAMLESLRVIQNEPERRESLASLRQLALRRIQELGLQSTSGGTAPIVPIIVPGAAAVQHVAASLQQRGFFVPAIRSPTVRTGTERLRLSFCAQHSPEQVDSVIHAVAQCQE